MDFKKQFENYCTSYLDKKTLSKPADKGDIQWQAEKPHLLANLIREINSTLIQEAENINKQAEANGEYDLLPYFQNLITQKINEFREQHS